MKTMCIIISVLVAALALVAYSYVKLNKWTPEFGASVSDEDGQCKEAESLSRLPARDSKGRFAKQK